MVKVRIALCAALLAGSAGVVGAQQPPATLTLDEAVQLARRYSPAYLAQANDAGVADWDLRAAYGSLLPSLSVGSSLEWQGGGTPNLGVLSSGDFGLSETPDFLFSSYGVRLNFNVSGGTFFRLAQERAARAATQARVEASTYTLESDVTRQYLVALRARDAVVLTRRELERAEAALALASARVDAGAAPRLDAAQAEVEKGRAEVALVQALASEESEKLRLLQRLGLELDRDIVLTTELKVEEPQWALEELTRIAMREHPQLVAARAAESAGRAAARSARTQYLPSLSISGGWSGSTRTTRNESYLIAQAEQSALSRIRSCEATNDLYSRLAQPLPPSDCSRFTFTDEARASILAQNDVWPFNFTKRPPSFSMTMSLPVFNGFNREAQMQNAAAAADDARHQRREEELNRRTAVATAHLALRAAYLSVGIEERNVVVADEQLELARERYRLGAGSILELTQAQSTKARADQAQLAARYAFHESLVALELAVGQRLR